MVVVEVWVSPAHRSQVQADALVGRQVDRRFLGAAGRNQARLHARDVGIAGQQVVVILLGGIGWQILMRLRSTPAMAMVIGDQAIAQRRHGRRLASALQGGLDYIAFGECVVAKSIECLSTDHFSQIRRVHLDRLLMRIGMVRLGNGLLVNRLGDVAVLEHLAQHPIAPGHPARRAIKRIDHRGQLKSRGDQRAFGRGQLVQRLAVVVGGRSAHTV